MNHQQQLGARAKDFTLAALATGYPSEEAFEALRLLRAELSSHAGLGPVLAEASDGLTSLRTAYCACFDVGAGHVPLYETEYGRSRGLAKGRDLADVMAFYRAFGLQLDEGGGTEMPDHLAVELEFYALLLHKQSLLQDDAEGTDIVAKARASFLREHLGGFALAVAAVASVAVHPVFGPLLGWCAELVARECAMLGVTVAPLEILSAKDTGDEVRCGVACTTAGTS